MPDPTIAGISLALLLGIWGALLSTALACVRMWELWMRRFRVEVGTMFTTSEDIGHRVSVRNLSDNPLILEYWQVVRLSGHWPRTRETSLVSPGAEVEDIAIPGHSTMPFTFAEQDHFPWVT